MEGGKNSAAFNKGTLCDSYQCYLRKQPLQRENPNQTLLPLQISEVLRKGSRQSAVENLGLSCLRSGTVDFILIHFIHALKLPFTPLKGCVRA